MARKTADQKIKEAEERITESVAQAMTQLTDRLDDRLGEIEEKVSGRRGPKVVETQMDDSELLETVAPTDEEVATWTPEQVKEFNERELKKMRARKQKQEAKRREMEGMGTQQRRQLMKEPRDPNEIRVAIDPDYEGDDYVRVQCKRKIGLGGGVMSDIDELVDMPREHAKRLQESGAVRIAL